MSKNSAIRQKLLQIENIQQRCYEELNQFGIELCKHPDAIDYEAHVSDHTRKYYGLSITHSYEKYAFYVKPGQLKYTLQILLFKEWKTSVNGFDPNQHEWRTSDEKLPKIKTFKDLIKVLKDC